MIPGAERIEHRHGTFLRLLFALLQAFVDRRLGGSAGLDMVPALQARQGGLQHLRWPS